MWTVDSETDPFKWQRIPRPFIWGAFNGSEYHVFARAADLVDFLSARQCIAYAHNGGKFDWHYLLEFVPSYTEIMVISGRLARFRIGQCEFRDSWNIIPVPQGQLSPKYNVDDWSVFEADKRDIPANRAQIEERLRTDCVELWHIVDKFIADYGIHLTQAGAAMDIWSRMANVEKPRTTSEFYSVLYPFYFGGRVEVFHPGEYFGDFVEIDVNGMYPFAMMHAHPYGETIYESRALPNSRGAIQRSFIAVECASRGALPYRDVDNSLAFPADGVTRVHHCTGWEFLAALETGVLSSYDIQRVLVLPATVDFKTYQQHFADVKTAATIAGDSARREFAKRFSVSLYGKFGANPDEYQEYLLVPPRFIQASESEGYQFCCEVGPHALVARALSDDKRHFYNVAVAASVTGFGRALLWRALRSVELPLYCDTDGIKCRTTGNLPLHDTAAGAWKVEKQSDYGAFGGKKLYATRTTQQWRATHPKCKEWSTASKGVKLTHDQIIAIAQGHVVDFKPAAPQFSLLRGIHFQKRTIRRTTS